VIATPDQRLRVFVSSTLEELADEQAAARDAIESRRDPHDHAPASAARHNRERAHFW
jgi:hypothetical protein